MYKSQLKNMDIRQALADADMKQSELANLLDMEPNNLAHKLSYKELRQCDKDRLLKLIKGFRRDPDQIISVVRVQNLPKTPNGWIVARSEKAKLWYWGSYETEERAIMVAKQLGSGVVLEVST